MDKSTKNLIEYFSRKERQRFDGIMNPELIITDIEMRDDRVLGFKILDLGEALE